MYILFVFPNREWEELEQYNVQLKILVSDARVVVFVIDVRDFWFHAASLKLSPCSGAVKPNETSYCM